MPKRHKPRKGSLQFWPRVRAEKILPSVNWTPLYGREKTGQKILGFFGYKAGMLRVLVNDLTQHSMTKNKEIVVPVTVIECPPLKLYSIRLYKNGRVVAEAVVSNEKELKKIVKAPKELQLAKLPDIEKSIEGYDDAKIILYSDIRKIHLKKTPDISEIALSGSIKEKFEFAKGLIGKEINISDVFSAGQLIDVHAVTKGHGFQGPMKRFGIGKRSHKSEKGVRRPGTLGPWTPSKVMFYAPQAGQTGFFTRVIYNSKIIKIASAEINPKKGFHRYGFVKNPCLLMKGSIQGPAKRPVLLAISARPSKNAGKKNYEIIKIMN
ncbi:50S ribosomal protein L3 [Candidatus Pacearchaeota archaeon]|nr:50S ribosomal protein L3 [Candidatus Pacearchaeota archaeon]